MGQKSRKRRKWKIIYILLSWKLHGCAHVVTNFFKKQLLQCVLVCISACMLGWFWNCMLSSMEKLVSCLTMEGHITTDGLWTNSTSGYLCYIILYVYTFVIQYYFAFAFPEAHKIGRTNFLHTIMFWKTN